MQIKLKAPKELKGRLTLPASKSISNRALIINALAQSNVMPRNVSDCDDTFVMVRALTERTKHIDIMAAGTAMRFLSAYLSVNNGTRVITGTARMKQRPISVLVEALRSLGCDIEYVEQEGFPPLRITGRTLEGGAVALPGNVSSQYISALLMIGPVMKNGLTLELTGDIISRPYINLTLQLMNTFGAKAEWSDENHIKVTNKPYKPTDYYIESDWSAASYWYQMLALSNDQEAEIVLPGLFSESYQGDSAVRHLFEKLGVKTEFFKDDEGLESVKLTKHTEVTSRFDYDFINQPDLAQTFVVTCTQLNIPFHFTGLQSLRIKETDRIAALVCELGKLGYPLTVANGSDLIWNGERTDIQANPSIDTYEDHRMAMAFAPCCLKMPEIRINHPEVVSKSYPSYWEHLHQVGFDISE